MRTDGQSEVDEVVLGVDWDSGGPGAGAGSNHVVKRRGKFWAVFPDHEETAGPYRTLTEAVARSSIGELTSACRAITYRRGEVRLKELIDALHPVEDELTIDINGTAWLFGDGRWRRIRD